MLRKPENNYSKTTHRWWIWLISICAIGFIIRLYFLPFDVPFTLDNIDYFGYAIEIKNIGELPKNWHIANNGWPSFMGVLFSIIPSEVFFDFVNFIRISTSIISVITVIPIYLLCKKFFGSYLGLIGAALFAFNPRIIINSTEGGIEPLYILVATLICLLFFYRNYKAILIAFALVGIISHLRYEAFILIIPISILYFLNSKQEIKSVTKYLICITIFLIVLIPLLTINYNNTGEDGLFSQFSSGFNRSYTQFIEGDFSDDVYKTDVIDGVESTHYIWKGVTNLIKFLGLSIIPVFIVLIPYGIYAVFKERNYRKNVIIILSFFLLIPAFYAYVSGFNDIRYLFILYPIFCFVSLFIFQKINDKVKKPTLFLISIILILIFVALFTNFEYKDQIENSRESFLVAQKVVDIATGYNDFSPESQFIKAAEMEDRWPESPVASQSGHVVRDRLFIEYDDSETLEEFIQNSRDITIHNKSTHPAHQFWFVDTSGKHLLDPLYYWSDGTKKHMPIGLSHLVVDNRNDRPKFIQDVYDNEEKYVYLIKEFDSTDFGLNHKLKIFKINYEIFDQIYK